MGIARAAARHPALAVRQSDMAPKSLYGSRHEGRNRIAAISMGSASFGDWGLVSTLSAPILSQLIIIDFVCWLARAALPAANRIPS